MRKIEERMIEAIKERKTFSLNNTRVTELNKDNQQGVFLHDNLIAVIRWVKHSRGAVSAPVFELKDIDCTLAGWGTVTTRSRLNAICRGFGMPSRFGQRKGRQVFDDDLIGENDWVTL